MRLPSPVPVEVEDEDSSCSYRFPMLKTFVSSNECNKLLNPLYVHIVYDITLILSIICVKLDPSTHMRCIWFLSGNRV
jgi:hypothetical protein